MPDSPGFSTSVMQRGTVAIGWMWARIGDQMLSPGAKSDSAELIRLSTISFLSCPHLEHDRAMNRPSVRPNPRSRVQGPFQTHLPLEHRWMLFHSCLILERRCAQCQIPLAPPRICCDAPLPHTGLQTCYARSSRHSPATRVPRRRAREAGVPDHRIVGPGSEENKVNAELIHLSTYCGWRQVGGRVCERRKRA
jgi:hypothetical protein